MEPVLVERDNVGEDGTVARFVFLAPSTHPKNFQAVIDPEPEGSGLAALRRALAPGWEAFARSRPVPLFDSMTGRVHLGCFIEREEGVSVSIYRSYGPVDDLPPGMLDFVSEVAELVEQLAAEPEAT
jgi:hypothetical protein